MKSQRSFITSLHSVPDFIYQMYKVSKHVPPNRDIIKDISLSFFYGVKIGVLGHNGSGKSTLLRIMAGLDDDYTGEARLGDGFTVGLLEQEPKLDPEKTVRQEVESALGEIFEAKDKLEGAASSIASLAA